MSAADCTLGPLARSSRERGEVVMIFFTGGVYRAVAGDQDAIAKTAQLACDALERKIERKQRLDSPESAEFDMIAKTVYPKG